MAERQRAAFGNAGDPAEPDFGLLLAHPLVDAALPPDWKATVETVHLSKLWRTTDELRRYDYQAFVSAGGSGMGPRGQPRIGSVGMFPTSLGKSEAK